MFCPSAVKRAKSTLPRRNVTRTWVADAVALAVEPTRRPVQKAAAPRSMAAATMAAALRAPRDRAADAAAPVDNPDVPDRDSRSNARSWADWNRRSGFFSRQWRTMRSRPGEIAWFVTERSGGSSFRIADMVSAAESP